MTYVFIKLLGCFYRSFDELDVFPPLQSQLMHVQACVLTLASLHTPGALHQDTMAQLPVRKKTKKKPKLNLNQVPICFVKPLESSLEIPAESAQPSSHRHCKGAAPVPEHSLWHLGHWPGVWACGGCVCMCLHTISQTSRDTYGEDHTGEPPRRAVLHACCY